MKLYAIITNERDSRAGKKGGDEFLEIELSAEYRPHILRENNMAGGTTAVHPKAALPPIIISNSDIPQ